MPLTCDFVLGTGDRAMPVSDHASVIRGAEPKCGWDWICRVHAWLDADVGILRGEADVTKIDAV